MAICHNLQVADRGFCDRKTPISGVWHQPPRRLLRWWVHPGADRVVVRERVNQYGRGAFKWEQVPSTIIDADAPSSGHTALVLSELQEFLPAWTHPSTSPPTLNIDETQPAVPKRRRWRLRRYRPPR